MLLCEDHIVPPLVEKKRISDYAINIFNTIPTRKGIKKAIKKGKVTINNSVAYTGDWLIGGECIKLVLEENILPIYEHKYSVVYEDQNLAVIHKPAGIPVHSNGHRNIQNSLSYNIAISSASDALAIPRPVHRLDYETEGLLIVAKSYAAMTNLGEAFANNDIHKGYMAVTIGTMEIKGTVDDAIDGKLCITKYEVLETVISEKYGSLNLVKVEIEHGRRNQIRKHLYSIGNPILGDKKFYKEGKLSYGNGLYLIANSLSFIHPSTKKEMDLKIPMKKKYTRLFPLGANMLQVNK